MKPDRILYGAAIFLGAFLLFSIEPMAARRLLPALGGSSAVWITCLVFFQTVLLLGYLYAHGLARRASLRASAIVHIALLTAAAALLVLVAAPDLSHAADHPLHAIFRTLSTTIGLQFLLLASTSPLLQSWYARAEQGSIPWRLFALSNAGSLLALILYPTVIEPHLRLSSQRAAWSIGFGVYAILCAWIAWRLRTNRAGALAVLPNEHEFAAPASMLRARLLWFLLPCAASMQLCAVTSHLSQNIAAIPLLWILPLIVYLLTFIVAFESPRLYNRWLIVRLLVVMLASLGYMLSKIDVSLPILIAIVFFLIELFLACFFCHGETYALRPARASQATLFYLLIAAGGAAGTAFIGLACPLLFDANYDVAIAFLATAAVAIAAVWDSGWSQRLVWTAATAGLLALCIMLHIVYARNSLLAERNFYGALRVKQARYPPPIFTERTLFNGTIEHGTQWFGSDTRGIPTTYYAADSGVGLAIRYCCTAAGGSEAPRNIGVIGLGVGTLAAYGRPGDRMRFYEINPAVLPIAQHLFTYLRESGAQLSFIPGDARLSLAAEPPQRYNVLVIDAFSGDAIPIHLLTTEALALYRRHLAPGGILAFHVSNRYVNLPPEIDALARSAGLQALLVDTPAQDARGEYRAIWVLVTDNSAFLAKPELAAGVSLPRNPQVQAWTDDFSSLLPLLRFQLARPR